MVKTTARTAKTMLAAKKARKTITNRSKPIRVAAAQEPSRAQAPRATLAAAVVPKIMKARIKTARRVAVQPATILHQLHVRIAPRPVAAARAAITIRVAAIAAARITVAVVTVAMITKLAVLMAVTTVPA